LARRWAKSSKTCGEPCAVSLYENRSRRAGMLLGRWWDLLSPLLQILIYWFVFSVGLGTQEKNGFPYHLWLMCGMMPWLALNSAILGASASIQQAASIIRNVRIPLSIIPMKAVVRAYYEHLWTMAILLIALLLGGVPVTWHYLELAYYLAASWVLLIGAALLTSSLTAVFRDFGELLQRCCACCSTFPASCGRLTGCRRACSA